ncbi:MAG: hypothetical protein IIB87_06390 [Chloroflexi bacterium]|nr:hypothetical protein [Chloroflexota bacterium]
MEPLHRLTSLVLWGLVIALAGIVAGTGASSGQDLNHADLVIVFPDGRVETRCVLFEEEEISGAELLRRSGLSVVFSSSGGFGEGVCRIDDTGCSDPGSCYCQCSGGDCAYWAYFGLADGQWRFQNVGPSQRMIRDGDTDAWVWGAGGGPPPVAELTAACRDDAVTTLAPPTIVPSAATPTTAARPTVSPTRAPLDDRLTRVDPTATEPAQVVGEPDDAEPTDVVESAQAMEDDGSGAPVGLIAFGAVAAALVVIAAGLAIRRRPNV